MNKLIIGCIADDFTGASDGASFLKKGGLNTVLISGETYTTAVLPEDIQAVVVALKIRSVPTEEAVEKALAAARWLKNAGAEVLYYKYCSTFDSTRQGNIGPVCDALAEHCGSRTVLLCPSLPANGRTVKGGILYVNGVPLADSPMRFHPLNPMWSSEICELMSPQSRYPVFTEKSKIPKEGISYYVPDYVDDSDGRDIVQNHAGLPLMTGGSGLLEHLASRFSSDTGSDFRFPSVPEGRRVIIAGSCSEMTRCQIARYIAVGGIAYKIDPLALCSGKDEIGRLKQIIQNAQNDVLLYSSDTPQNIDQCRISCSADISERLEALAGELALYAVNCGVNKLVVAGGETAGAVISRLPFSVYRIGICLAPGVPEMVPAEYEQLHLALKSGNFVNEDFFVNTLI